MRYYCQQLLVILFLFQALAGIRVFNYIRDESPGFSENQSNVLAG